MQLVEFNQIFGLGMGMSRNPRKPIFFFFLGGGVGGVLNKVRNRNWQTLKKRVRVSRYPCFFNSHLESNCAKTFINPEAKNKVS